MTFPRITGIDPGQLYASMGAEALQAHVAAAVAALAGAGVEITPAVRLGLDELDESVTEHLARTDKPAFERRLAKVRASVAEGLN